MWKNAMMLEVGCLDWAGSLIKLGGCSTPVPSGGVATGGKPMNWREWRSRKLRLM